MLIDETLNLPEDKVVEEKLIKAINWGDWEGKSYTENFGNIDGG